MNLWPSMTKRNFRYRGPIESTKMNKTTSEEFYIAFQLYKQLTTNQETITTIQQQSITGGSQVLVNGIPVQVTGMNGLSALLNGTQILIDQIGSEL